jgi:hypothetical protein
VQTRALGGRPERLRRDHRHIVAAAAQDTADAYERMDVSARADWRQQEMGH